MSIGMAIVAPRTELATAVVRFSGDPGHGIHLAGDHLSRTSAAIGNAVFTWPDFPAEIRSPAGTFSGVTAFQIQFGAEALTPGDRVHTLVAMNPAALRINLPEVEPGGILVVNTDTFVPEEWVKAGYERDPLTDGTLVGFRLIRAPVLTLNREAVAGLRLSPREADRSQSFFALGLVYWLYDRPLESTLHWLKERFPNQPDVYKAGKRSLKAGYEFGESLRSKSVGCRVPAKTFGPGVYRRVNGITSLALGLAAAASRSGREVIFSSFPSTSAAELLDYLVEQRPPGVVPLQAEDDVSAAGMALGAAYGGAIGVVGCGGMGLGAAAEIIGLGVMAELPLVVIQVQQGGPALGLPGKPEQADLLQAITGRNGECPVPVVAMRSPADGFPIILEAVRLAMRYMTPVVVLTDSYALNAAEPWLVPAVESLPPLPTPVPVHSTGSNPKSFLPYARDVRLARPWATPGTPGLEHRIGGLEKEDGTGVVSYEPADHEHMINVRAQKIAQITGDIPRLQINGPAEGDVLLIGWGSTYGAIAAAASKLRMRGYPVAHAHLRHLNPLPENTESVLRRYRRVVAPELNTGQLRHWLRAQFLLDVQTMSKVQGRPFLVSEIEEWVVDMFRPRRKTEELGL